MSKIPSDSANSIQVMKVCQAITQLGHEVTLLVPGPQPKNLPDTDLLDHYGLKNLFVIEWLPVKSRRMFPWKASARARQLGADLLYTWPVQSAVLGLFSGMPSMLEMHDLPGGTFGPLWFWLFRVIPGRKRALPITDALRRELNLQKDIAVVVPNGVELERYSALPDAASARKELGLPGGKTVLCTGHLYTGRGGQLFLDLAAKFPAVNFVWVGGRKEDVSTWRQRAADLTNVTFTGFIANQRIPMYQAAADVLLMPYERMIAGSSGGNSADICSPMKMFEYMASRRAILTSDLPVIHEVLDDKSAVFCPPGDTQAWCLALENLLSDDEHRYTIGQSAFRAAQDYSWIERARRSLGGF
jgi:glycosyltransferase involved in cell wall biosynthesis